MSNKRTTFEFKSLLWNKNIPSEDDSLLYCITIMPIFNFPRPRCSLSLSLSLSLSCSLSYMHSYYVLEFHSKRFKSSCLEIVRLSYITWISQKNKLLKSACNLDNIALLIFLCAVYGWQGHNDIMGVNVVVLFRDYPI